jgi:rhodanese-related sulfurtransferase
MTLSHLLSYAPPALFLAWFIRRRIQFRRLRAQLPSLLQKGAVVLDVRSPGEYATGFSPGSLNIPLDQLTSRASELDQARPVILCCASGARSGMAAVILRGKGFTQVLNAGPWTNTLREDGQNS